jgi:excisionase family DNA binding protein
MTKMFYDVDESAAVAHIGPAKIRQLVKDGSLPARRVGKRILITPEDLLAWRDALPRVVAA